VTSAITAMAAETRDAPAPYLSVVVTSRNDGHGGDPLARLQAFVNTFHAQCRRFGLDAEVVVVEWNPPADRPRLHQLVTPPPGCAFTLRFIEVPAAVHNGLPHAHVLPLFQMIGKNVGSRRSRGEFVLCTNIDIIFSNELVQYFASRALEHGVLYRVDRHDIESDYPGEATLDEQLAYCGAHHLRVHRAWGTFPVDSHGRLVTMNADIFDPPSVTIGDGWHVREGGESSGSYRWAMGSSTLIVNRVGVEFAAGAALALDIEPNPYDSGSWVDLEIAGDGVTLTRAHIDDRRRLWVPLPDSIGRQEIVLRTLDSSPGSEQTMPAFERRRNLAYRVRSARLTHMPVGVRRSAPYDASRWRKVHRDVEVEKASGGLMVRSAPAQHTYCLRYGPLYVPRTDRYTFVMDCTCLDGNVSMHLVDEAADRFVPADEFEMAEGDRRLLVASANLTRGQACSVYVANRHRGGDGVSTFAVHALQGSVPLTELELQMNAPVLAGALRRLSMKAVRSATRRVASVFQRATSDRGTANERTSAAVTSQPPNASGHAALTSRIEAFCKKNRLASVHRNAAGDFQLMARRHWFDLHGYAEFTMYSMNIDGLLGDVAHHAGIREEILSMPRGIYHLEHAQGSGWTPEGEGLLRKRLSDSGADWLDASTVDLWSAYMDWLKRPMIFNGPDWGVGDVVLHETTLDTTVDKA
jgi:hypothetical protein